MNINRRANVKRKQKKHLNDIDTQRRGGCRMSAIQTGGIPTWVSRTIHDFRSRRERRDAAFTLQGNADGRRQSRESHPPELRRYRIAISTETIVGYRSPAPKSVLGVNPSPLRPSVVATLSLSLSARPRRCVSVRAFESATIRVDRTYHSGTRYRPTIARFANEKVLWHCRDRYRHFPDAYRARRGPRVVIWRARRERDANRSDSWIYRKHTYNVCRYFTVIRKYTDVIY